MSASVILAFCAPSDRERVRAVCPDAVWHDSAAALVVDGLPGLILLAIGPEGGAALARWVDAHGLEGVTGVGLVGVTAPWAVRSQGRCPKHYHLCGDEACEPNEHRLHLGPLEPLRAVAERARVGVSCECTAHGGPNHRDGGPCQSGTRFPIRIVVACAPDDGVCARCKGKAHRGYRMIGNATCPDCSGAGKALSSADVAGEFWGLNADDVPMASFPRRPLTSYSVAGLGGLAIIEYPTRAALAEHGLRSGVERLTR